VAASEMTKEIPKDIKVKKKNTAIPEKIPQDFNKGLFDPKGKQMLKYYKIIKLVY
jgi:hypothetical protein